MCKQRDKTIKREYYALICLVLLILSLYAVKSFANVSIEVISTDSCPEENWYFAEIMHYIDEMDSPNIFISDKVYIITRSAFLPHSEVTAFVPCIKYRVGDVPTAGAAEWCYEVGFYSMSWKKQNRVQTADLYIDKSRYTIQADKNTTLLFDGRREDTLNITLQDSDEYEGDESSSWCCLDVLAMTKNSNYSQNERCSASIKWSGECVVCNWWRPEVRIKFNIKCDFPYINNVVNCA